MATDSGRKKLFNNLAALIVFIFITNALANKFYWYSSVWYFDIIMHFLGGFWVGLLAFFFLSPGNISRRLILKLLAFVILFGAGWEFFEIFVDKAISRNAFNAADTFADLFFDAAGGMVSMIYYMKCIRRRSGVEVQ